VTSTTKFLFEQTNDGANQPKVGAVRNFPAGRQMSHIECLTAALRELDAAGIRDVSRSYGSKHLQLRWSVNDRGPRMYTLALTPSDWRAPNNVASDIRRMLREDGLLTAGPPKPPKPPDRITRLEARVAALETTLREILKQTKQHENEPAGRVADGGSLQPAGQSNSQWSRTPHQQDTELTNVHPTAPRDDL
jgi:hypothetical protein